MRMNKACAVKPQPNYGNPTPIGFAAFEAACVNVVSASTSPQWVSVAQPTKREYTMIDQEIEQRRYLLDRTRSVQINKARELGKTFGLEDDVRPSSPEDMIKRIQDGMYVLTARDQFDDDDDCFRTCAFDRLHWRDPAKVRDNAGYEAANERMAKAATQLNDTVRLTPIADAFKAFKEFNDTDFATIH